MLRYIALLVLFAASAIADDLPPWFLKMQQRDQKRLNDNAVYIPNTTILEPRFKALRPGKKHTAMKRMERERKDRPYMQGMYRKDILLGIWP